MSNLALRDYGERRNNAIKQLYESNVVKITNARRVEQAITFFNLLHGSSYKEDEVKFIILANAYIQQDTNELGWEQWGFKTSQIEWNYISSFLTLDNCYMTVHNFISPFRTNDNCFQLTCFFIDIDYYKIDEYKNKTCEEMIKIMRDKGLFKNLEPSFFVDSGNGMYLYYLLENTMNGQLDNLRYVWSRTEDSLIKRFSEFGADAQACDISRVVRVPGSKNPKTGEIARLIYNTEKETYRYDVYKEVKKYKLKEITDVLLDKKKKKSDSKRATYRGAIVLNWSINVAYKRCRDLEKLVELRGNCQGARDFICLLYRHSLLHQNFSEEESLQKTVELAMKMKDFNYKNFDVNYIERATKPVVRYHKNFIKAQQDYEKTDKSITFTKFVKDKKCMLWTNAKMIKELGITQEEMEHMLTLFNQKEKNRRDKENYNPSKRKEKYKKRLAKEGKMLKTEEIEICIKKMKDLLAQGLSSKEIMKILNLKKSTFYDYKKQIEN